MKLKSAHIENFRSIEDSEKFAIDDVTCLVGKNESGKTAILQALHKLNPSSGSGFFSKDTDYPKRRLGQYQENYGRLGPVAVRTEWELSQEEVSMIEEKFGAGCLLSHEIKIFKYYENNNRTWNAPYDEEIIANHLLSQANFDAREKAQLKGCKTVEDIAKKLASIASVTGLTEKQKALKEQIDGYEGGSVRSAIRREVFQYVPNFLYLSNYNLMEGKISVDYMQANEEEAEESIFIDLLGLAGTSLDDLEKIDQYNILKNKVESVSNNITRTILSHWSQNKNLKVKVDFREAKSGDKHPYDSGQVAEVRIEDKSDEVTLPFEDRSSGFIWFFSFLVKFKALSKNNDNIIILLDEPGLTLHAKAQADLLKYIEKELKPKHQVIYTTHSPFMIPTDNLASVRIVENIAKDGKPLGTKVSEDSLRVTEDSLFPLQSALGYEITQSLFIGQNILLVEGPSDMHYLKAASEALRKQDLIYLDSKWTICPTCGSGKVQAFVSLFSGNELNIAVLIDFAEGDKNKIRKMRETLHDKKILDEKRIMDYAQFLNQDEADVEDMFGVSLFAQMLNNTYNLKGDDVLDDEKLMKADDSCRVVKKAEAYFKLLDNKIPTFDHYDPALWLFENNDILMEDNQQTKDVLKRFEKIFKKLNTFLS